MDRIRVAKETLRDLIVQIETGDFDWDNRQALAQTLRDVATDVETCETVASSYAEEARDWERSLRERLFQAILDLESNSRADKRVRERLSYNQEIGKLENQLTVFGERVRDLGGDPWNSGRMTNKGMAPCSDDDQNQ